MSKGFQTEMMQQYTRLKQQHDDCLLFFRLGDFYELFLEDAKIGAKVLDITLTARDRGKDGKVPMAGVPYHALDSYLSKLVKSGYKVAICEQVSEPSAGKLVDREVVRIVTPGTLIDEKALDNKSNNYIVSVSPYENKLGIAVADISTGEFKAAQHVYEKDEQQILVQELTKFSPTECVISADLYNDPFFLNKLVFDRKLNIFPFHNWPLFAADEATARKVLEDHFNVKSLHAYSLHEEPAALVASAGLLGYLKHTQKGNVTHIKKLYKYNADKSVVLDRATINNLEIFKTLRDGSNKGSLVSALDNTKTSMGSRLLKRWLTYPLSDINQINNRLSAVEYFISNRSLRKSIESNLENAFDIERLVSKISLSLGNGRDLVRLKISLTESLNIKNQISSTNISYLDNLQNDITKNVSTVVNLIEKYIVDEPPIEITEGNLIKSGVHKKLDELRQSISKSKSWIAQLEEKEREKTGISTLKVSYNKVFGYYIEVSKTKSDDVPKSYIRKQTLVNAERFITPELKEKEELVLSADEKINKLEHELFKEIVNEILKYIDDLYLAANCVATIDCLINFSNIAEKYNYCKPKINKNGKLDVLASRHPVVEQLTQHNTFVPNDVLLDTKEDQLAIITGPNMAGKSVYIRQVALLVLLAHIGSYVPAKSARISLVDRIFVRSGASDVITEGLSTFMVEMIEAAYILNHATKDSLIVMDEIGRGTSTYDGISIASAIAQYLVTNFKDEGPKTLFATHYHELQYLADKYPKIRNIQMAVKHENGEPVFLHKVVEGGASKSFGLSVAKMAGVPDLVTQNASDILDTLENGESLKNNTSKNKKVIEIEKNVINPAVQKIKEIDVNSLTPLDALNLLSELKELANTNA